MSLAAERELGRRSLYDFASLAWAQVEPSSFVGNWHLEALADFLTEVSSGSIRRGVVNVPPGTGKSLFSGVFWPAWVWISSPETRWQNVSYDDALVTRDASKLIRLLRSEWFVARWGERLPRGALAISNFATLAGGGRLSTSIRGAATGWHCDIQAFDDPVKPAEAAIVTGRALEATWETIENTFGSRARHVPTFRRLIIQQRIHEDDPAGRAIDRGWTPLIFPMLYDPEIGDLRDARTSAGEPLFPERYPLEELDRMRSSGDVSADTWETQYQQRPARKGGSIFQEGWIDVVDPSVVANVHGRSIQSWDLAFKGGETSDCVAGQWWRSAWVDGVSHFFLCDVPSFEARTFLETLNEIRWRRETWPSEEALIEDKANGPAIDDVLSKEFPGWVRTVNPEGGKTARAHAISKYWAAKRVHLVNGPHVARWRTTLSRFPRVKRDDEIDAMTQALRELADDDPVFAALRNLRQ